MKILHHYRAVSNRGLHKNLIIDKLTDKLCPIVE